MINMLLRAAADVLVPLAGRAVLFIAEDGVPAYMDSAGVVHTLQGGQGEQGDQGPDGLSAYQVWLAAGNVGTEADYLASLKGEKGDKGDKGDAGPGLPAGGVAGQVPVKASGSDFDMAWTTLTAGDVGAQPANDNLTGIAALTLSANQSAYYNGTAWATYSLTAAGRALSAVAGTANTFPYFSAANVVTLGAVGATGLASMAAANQAAGRTAVQAVGLSGDENIAGIKTFTSNNAIRSLAAGAGFWIESLGATYGFMVNTDGTRLNVNLRSPNFGAQVMTTYQITDSGVRTGVPFTPFSANTQTVGSSALPFNTFYAQNTTISTSDARLKTEPRQLRDAEFKAASAIARLPAVWRWLNRVHGDENCEPEGREARKHFGPTVQAAIAVMEAHGLAPFAYSFICYDEWEALPEQWHEWEAQEAVLDDDGNEIEPAIEAGRELVQEAREAGDRYSFRKEELLCFIVRAMAQEIDGLSDRLSAIEARLA